MWHNKSYASIDISRNVNIYIYIYIYGGVIEHFILNSKVDTENPTSPFNRAHIHLQKTTFQRNLHQGEKIKNLHYLKQSIFFQSSNGNVVVKKYFISILYV